MDTVIDKLSEIEAAAQAITDEANARKKAFAQEMDQKTKAFDAELEQETSARIRDVYKRQAHSLSEMKLNVNHMLLLNFPIVNSFLVCNQMPGCGRKMK